MSTPSSLPATMQAVFLPGPGEPLALGEMPVPQPGPGQVLIKIAASPINPSDLSFLQGQYGVKKAYPSVPGFEASGTVVAAGKGPLPRFWLGKRVACAADDRLPGAWAEYMVTSAQRCVPLLRAVPDEQGSMLLANPLTALAFFDRIKKEKIKGVVANAAASALGRMIIRLGRQRGVAVIAVVRREEQVNELMQLGATACFNSQATDFEARLAEATAKHQATLLLDAVAGELSQQVLRAMPRRSQAWVYGNLSLSEIGVASRTLIFEEKRIEGFWLSQVLARKSFWQAFLDTQRVQRLLDGVLDTQVQGRFGLAEAQMGVAQYKAQMSQGKVLIMPGAAEAKP